MYLVSLISPMEDLWIVLSLLLGLLCLSILVPQLQYLVKFLYLYLVTQWASLLLIAITLPRPNHPRNGVIAARILRAIYRTIGIRWRVEGENNLNLSSGAVVVLNHQSSIDTIAITVVWPMLERAAPVLKKALLYNGPFGLASWLMGCIFVDRGQKSSRMAMSEAGENAKKNMIKLVIFPEGTRNSGGNLSMLPFKKGAFHIALDAKLPILPIVISEYKFLDHSKLKFGSGDVVIRVLPPIETSEFNKDTIDQLIEKTRNKMLETLAEISK